MNTALILAGGSGTRLGSDMPKQFLTVNGRPLIMYCLETFNLHPLVNDIVIVISKEWESFMAEWLDREQITKFRDFAPAGKSRQHSIWYGLQKLQIFDTENDDIVIVHDAARPCVNADLITGCVENLTNADAAMPVITVKDTTYMSKDGIRIDSLLNRDELYAGQAPESFRYGKYYRFHENMTDDELSAVRGTTEIAYRNGLTVRMFPGDESNYKITTQDDFEKFRMQIENKRQKG